jgi:hypothetical protein
LLAYVFWHRPRPGVEATRYEEAQRSFHEGLEVVSACFRVERLPFGGGPGYEDWYLVEDWTGLGELNAAAVDAGHRTEHDRAAALVGEGWGAVYACVGGSAAIPTVAEWLDKPRGQRAAEFIAGLGEDLTIWRRQMVLGPAPEFCVADGEAEPPPYRRDLL